MITVSAFAEHAQIEINFGRRSNPHATLVSIGALHLRRSNPRLDASRSVKAHEGCVGRGQQRRRNYSSGTGSVRKRLIIRVPSIWLLRWTVKANGRLSK